MKIDDIQKIAYNHNLQEIKQIKEKYLPNLKLLEQMIDSKIIEETRKGEDSVYIDDDDLKVMLSDCNITSKYDNISIKNWCQVIAYIYRKQGFTVILSFNHFSIYWDTDDPDSIDDDINKIFNSNEQENNSEFDASTKADDINNAQKIRQAILGTLHFNQASTNSSNVSDNNDSDDDLPDIPDNNDESDNLDGLPDIPDNDDESDDLDGLPDVPDSNDESDDLDGLPDIPDNDDESDDLDSLPDIQNNGDKSNDLNDLPDVQNNDDESDDLDKFLSKNNESDNTSENNTENHAKNYVESYIVQSTDVVIANELNNIYNKFEQYFGKKYLSKEIVDNNYIIRLQVHENKSFKYSFVWQIDYSKVQVSSDNNYYLYDNLFESLANSIKFIVADKSTNTENEVKPTILKNTMKDLSYSKYGNDFSLNLATDSGYVNIDLDDEAATMMIPIVRGYLHSKKRLALYEKASKIYDLKSFKQLYYKYRLSSVLWINATAPNSLSLNINHAYPKLKLIANTGACSSKGIYFHDFDWSQYHNDKQATAAFYRYVWHEAVNLYYFKQDYYVYNLIFGFGDHRDFRDAFVNYSVDCRFLATKANIVVNKKAKKDMSHAWSTTRTPEPIIKNSIDDRWF